MDAINPVEWFSWIYGKWFQGHPYLGFLAVLCAAAVVLGIVWTRAIDKFEDAQAKGPETSSNEPDSVKLKRLLYDKTGVGEMAVFLPLTEQGSYLVAADPRETQILWEDRPEKGMSSITAAQFMHKEQVIKAANKLFRDGYTRDITKIGIAQWKITPSDDAMRIRRLYDKQVRDAVIPPYR